MWNFLKHLWRLVVSDFKSIWHWIIKAIAAIYTVIADISNTMSRGFVDIWNATVKLADEIESYAVSVYNWAKATINAVWNDIVKWVVGLWHDLSTAIDAVYKFAAHWIDWILNWVGKLFNDITSWVIRDIWNPLYTAITSAWNWIYKYGAMMLYLLTHPDALVRLIAAYLWREWMNIVRHYARPIGHWLIRVMPSMAGELASLIEDIISSLI